MTQDLAIGKAPSPTFSSGTISKLSSHALQSIPHGTTLLHLALPNQSENNMKKTSIREKKCIIISKSVNSLSSKALASPRVIG
jgi:hypothetical protein